MKAVFATAADIAIVPAVSTAAGIVAANLPPAGTGENVVIWRKNWCAARN
jgi:hypothetical protein